MSILGHVEEVPPDPIFGLGALIKRDPNENKVDLTVGVYRSENLKVETMRSVKAAEEQLLQKEKNKVYLPLGGKEDFIQVSRQLVFGKEFVDAEAKRYAGVQSIGGTGALRVGGELLRRELTNGLYLPDPTWANHEAIFKACQMEVKKYPYYDEDSHAIVFSQLLNALAKTPKNSVVLLHACCHNPTGCDLSLEQWKELSAFMRKHQLIPFFDFAYQGFSRGVEEDAWPIRYFASQGHELFVAHSFSKSFGLYGERVGALHVLLKDRESAKKVLTILTQINRVSFSTPPRHGASLAAAVVHDKEFHAMWEKELTQMRIRAEEMRSALSDALELRFGRDRFGFFKNRTGFISTLDLEDAVVDQLIERYSVYTAKNGRINLTGLNRKNISYVVDAIADVCSA